MKKPKFVDPLLKVRGVDTHAEMRAGFRAHAEKNGIPQGKPSWAGMTFGRRYGKKTMIKE